MFDIPQITVRVVEHRLISRRCACGALTAAAGPAGVTAPVSYGPSAAAIAVYLVLGQHLPVERTACLLAELFGTPMAAGTVAAWTTRAAAGLAPFTAAARRALAEAELVHADESGLRVAGRLHWLHVASSTRFTSLFCHRRRGKDGIDAAGVLPAVTGTLVHDAFAPYAHYRSATHALCNAHLLRELIAVVDSHTAHPPGGADTPRGWCWATQIIDALLALKAITDTGVLPDPDTLAAHRRLIVSAVGLRDFRSYAKLELALEPGLVLVTGPNGAGKTNLLESLHVGTQGFSPRTRADAQLVRLGREAARIALRGDRAGVPVELEVTLELGTGKRASLNGARLRAAETPPA